MDNEYYILESGQKIGPFTPQELMDRPLEPDDLVVMPLQNQGTEAHLLPEFKQYFIDEGLYYPMPENTASYFLRLPAYIIDFIIIVFGTEILAFILFPGYMSRLMGVFTLSALTDPKLQENLLKHQTEIIIIQLVVFVVTVLYNSLCEAGRMRGSVGKYILGLAVVDGLGYGLTFWHALRRNLGKTIYEVLGLIIGPLSYLAYMKIIWSFRHQAIHDQLAGCFVVKRSK